MRIRKLCALAAFALATISSAGQAARYVQVHFEGSVFHDQYNPLTNDYLGHFEEHSQGDITLDTLDVSGGPLFQPDGTMLFAAFSPTAFSAHAEHMGPLFSLAAIFPELTLDDSGAWLAIAPETSSFTEWVALSRYGTTPIDGTLTGLAVRSSDTIFAGGLGLSNYLTSVTAVPEPASWAMLIAGFGCVGALLRRARPRVAVAHA